MSLGGGGDRAWLEPTDQQGNREGTTGCHTGTTEGLNVDNAQPGYSYLWARNDAASIRFEMRRGYRLVGDSDPEMARMKELGSTNSSTVDTTMLYGDVILMKAPVESVRKIREEEVRRAQMQLRSGTDDFLNKVTAAERDLEFNPRGVATRFALSENQTQITDSHDEGGRVLDVWTSDQGIR